MNPNQPSQSQNPYGFILNPNQGQNSPNMRGVGGNSMRSRILLVVGGMVLLLVVGSILASVLSSAGTRDNKSLTDIVAQQQELIRVAELGSDKSSDYKTRSLAYTTKLSVTTQQQKLIAYLGENSVVVSKEQLASKLQANVEKELETAANNNRFDETFAKLLDTELRNYATAMKEVYDSVGSEKTREILAESFTSSVTLLGLQ